MAYTEPEGDDKSPIPLSDIADEALENYKLYKEVYADQEKRETEDLSWQDPQNMWDPAERLGRGPATVQGIAVPARPTMSVPMHKQPISLVLNQAQAADLSVQVHPISEESEDDTAEVQQDLYRAIVRDCNAQVVRFSAFKRSTWCGRGWYRVNAVYDESTADPFDLKIVLQRIVYQGAVFIDVSASNPDFSDANWGGVTGWMSEETFKATYPEADISTMPDDGTGDDSFYKIVPDWVKGNGSRRSIQVCEYFRKHYSREVIKFGDRERVSMKCRLWRYVLAPGGSGLEVVEAGEWNGPDIPLIPCIADELEAWDDKRRFFGMVRPTRDPCRVYNYAASQIVQRVGVEPLAPFVIGASQLEGYENIWAQANLRAFGYLPYNDKPDNSGQKQEGPKRTDVSSSAMGPAMVLLQESRGMIQAATATPDVSLGVRDSSYRSGKAEEKLQRQSEASKTNFLENYVQITLPYEAKVVLGMMARVYDRPGRVAKVIDMHGNVRSVMLNAKFVKDQTSERPVRVNDKAIPMERVAEDGSWQMKPGAQPMQEAKPKLYDLSKGSYGVSVQVGKSAPTRSQEAAEQIQAFIEAVPQFALALAPTVLKLQDWPGHDNAAEIAQKIVDHDMPYLANKEPGEETPDQLRAQIEQMQAQIQQQGQQLQQAADMLKQEQQKQDAVLQKANMDNAAKLDVEEMKAQTAQMVEAMKAETAKAIEAMKQEGENQRLAAQQAHEAALAEIKAAMAGEEAERADERAEGAAERAADREAMRGETE